MQVKICCFGSSKKENVICHTYFALTNELLTTIQNSTRSLTFVYGGGERGIMGRTRIACNDTNKVISSNVSKFVKYGEATDDFVYDLIVPRQNKLVELGDIFIGLPGGIGTLYEIFQVAYSNHLCPKKVDTRRQTQVVSSLEPKRSLTRPIYVSNQNGLYDDLKIIFEQLYSNGHKTLDCVIEPNELLSELVSSKLNDFAEFEFLPSETPYYETTCDEESYEYVATYPNIKTYYELTKYITFNDIGETNIKIIIKNENNAFDNFINLLHKLIQEHFISKQSLDQLGVTILL